MSASEMCCHLIVMASCLNSCNYWIVFQNTSTDKGTHTRQHETVGRIGSLGLCKGRLGR